MEYVQSDLHQNLIAAMPFAEGMSKLFSPYVEGAVHDLRQGKIVALYNNISRREVGDPSVVTNFGIDVADFPDVFEPYYKTNWDGRKLKCTSMTIRDENGAAIGLLCINLDTTVFDTMATQLNALLQLKDSGGLNPVEQFGVDWQRQADKLIDEYASETNVAIIAMNKDQKSELVQQLYRHGYFNYREAATYVAQKLGVSRATIYNYLKEEKEQ